MEDYRTLTDEEIGILEEQGCTADDWTAVLVAEEFTPAYIRNVEMHGSIRLGTFDSSIEVSAGFWKHSGVRNATLNNVTIGDGCLIENVGCYISNYDLHDGCYVSNVGTMETAEGATFGQGLVIAVLNEAGSGNIMLYPGLTSQVADLMVRCAGDSVTTERIRQMVRSEVDSNIPGRGYIGVRAKVVNTVEVSDTIIGDECEVSGASRVSNSTLTGPADTPSYIGVDVICENSIVTGSSSVTDGSHIDNCFIGEASTITSDFTAESSVFFANSYMANGETCAAFCGPFTVSHHKSTLLIGCQYSFYNAGSGSNFSNHAYKIGPVHYGRLCRGTKTGSGSHILLPATIGAFTVVLGKIKCHPDTRLLPFSYLIGEVDGKHYLVPGRSISSVGFFRDIRKWPRRDVRPASCKTSHVDFSWLNPVTVSTIVNGISILEKLENAGGTGVTEYVWNGLYIKSCFLRRGLDNYRMALNMYLSGVLTNNDCHEGSVNWDDVADNYEEWIDVSGLIMPQSELDDLTEALKDGTLSSLSDLSDRIGDIVSHRDALEYTWALSLIKTLGGEQKLAEVLANGAQAYNRWLDTIDADADREAALGDVDDELLAHFHTKIGEEREKKNF